MIVGFAGRKGAGKDTAAEYMVKHLNYTRLAFADPLKDVVSVAFNIPREVLDDPEMKEAIMPRYNCTPRRLLQVVGTELFRDTLPMHVPSASRIWIENMRTRIKNAPGKVVITDVRFADEAELVRELGGVIIEIVRAEEPRTQDTHVSESGAWGHVNGRIINNGTIADLRKAVATVFSCRM